MPLFVDSDIISLSDLKKVDSEVSAVIATEDADSVITVDGPGGICEQAWIECQQTILAAMQSYSSYPSQGGMPATHMAAVFNTGIPARTQPRVRLNQIVAGDANYSASQSPIQVWMVYCALSLFYRDAAARLTKEDRYEKKWERYEEEASRRWRRLRCNGLPMVYRPIEAPGAKHAFNSGTWNASNVTGANGGSNANTQNLVVAITWYDSSKYTSRVSPSSGDYDPAHNAESGPSSLISFPLAANQLLTVSIASLVPPNGQPDPVGFSQGTWSPLNATHWNIYAGVAPDVGSSAVLYLQKEGVPVATKSWTLSADPVSTGPVMTQGQYADMNLAFANVVMRG